MQLSTDSLPEPAAPRVVRAGSANIVLPTGLDGHWLSTDGCPASCAEFVARSPERTIYHSTEYMDFARRENGSAEMLVVRSQGTALFALPVHPSADGRWVSTGYSGVLFTADEREARVRASVAAFRALLDANPSMGFRVEQSAQSAAVERADRMALLGLLLNDERHVARATYTRIVQPIANGSVSNGASLESAALENAMLAGYDGDVRNQIRQALRNGLRVTPYVLDREAGGDETERAYRRYVPVHAESFLRTGMTPHRLDYWLGLSEAVQRGGGTDLVVLVSDADGADVAAVTCHLYEGRAIYWSGCSNAVGKASRANPLALHAAITVCGALGVTAFELGRFDAAERSPKEIAITRYKAQFRGRVTPVLNFTRPPQTVRAEVRALARVVRIRVPRIIAAATSQRASKREAS